MWSHEDSDNADNGKHMQGRMQPGNKQKLSWQEPCYALEPRMALLFYADTGNAAANAVCIPWHSPLLHYTSLHFA